MHIIEDVARTSKTLMFKEPFYGLFLISLNKLETKAIPTAAVGKHNINTQLLVNPDFWKSLDGDDNTKLAILKHELLHIAFFHLTTSNEYEDHELHNIAADLEINQYIEPSYKGPKWMGLELSHYAELNLPPKMGTRFYYDELSKIQQKRQQMGLSGNGQSLKGSGPNGEITADDLKDMMDRMKNGGGKGSPNDGSSPEKSKVWDVYDSMKRGEPTVCSHDTWKEFWDGLSEADRKLIEKQVNYQLKEIATEIQKKDRGLIPGELKGHIDSLFEIQPPATDWKAYLRRFGGSSNRVFTKKTRRKESKRYEDNPALKIKNRKNVLVAIDTSGSVSDKDLTEFINEIHHIYKAGVQVTIAQCDADIHDLKEYKGKFDGRIVGRGGTNFQPVIDHYNENWKKYNALVYLTDMECPPPTAPRTSMLWVACSTAADKDYSDFPGKVLKITR
jgi:hypothetical protein